MPGWILIRIEAFGLNRFVLHFGFGVAPTDLFSRISEIKAVGNVVGAPVHEYPVGAKIAAMMGEMGRTFDGGYAEYVSAPAWHCSDLHQLARVGRARRDARYLHAVCFTGMHSDLWTVREFYPKDWSPNGVRLSTDQGDASDLTQTVLQGFLDDVDARRARVPIRSIYKLNGIGQAHGARGMEHGVAGSKLVGIPR